MEALDSAAEAVFRTHQDSTWPHSREAAAMQFGHLDQAKTDKIAPWECDQTPGPRPALMRGR
jgi:hypothetical protein